MFKACLNDRSKWLFRRNPPRSHHFPFAFLFSLLQEWGPKDIHRNFVYPLNASYSSIFQKTSFYAKFDTSRCLTSLQHSTQYANWLVIYMYDLFDCKGFLRFWTGSSKPLKTTSYGQKKVFNDNTLWSDFLVANQIGGEEKVISTFIWIDGVLSQIKLFEESKTGNFPIPSSSFENVRVSA